MVVSPLTGILLPIIEWQSNTLATRRLMRFGLLFLNRTI